MSIFVVVYESKYREEPCRSLALFLTRAFADRGKAEEYLRDVDGKIKHDDRDTDAAWIEEVDFEP